MIIKLIINLSGFSGFFTRANHRDTCLNEFPNKMMDVSRHRSVDTLRSRHGALIFLGEVVGDTDHVGLDRNHLAGVELVLSGEFDHAMHRGLRVDHGVILLDGAFQNALVTLLVPVDAYLHVQQVVDAVGPLYHLQRSLHVATGEKQRVHRAKRRLRRGETFPLR